VVAAAVRVFARKGYADASIQDIADEADVVPTAVYYHFSGKDQLFEVALRHVLDATSEVAQSVRDDAMPVDAEVLVRGIEAVWAWLEEHPDEATFLYGHSPGATPQAQVLLRQYETRHVERAFDYLRADPLPDGSSPEDRRAEHLLAARTLINLLISVHGLRMEGGPLARHSSRALRAGLREVARRIVVGA
jgi:AcrR family transcriptional regulator